MNTTGYIREITNFIDFEKYIEAADKFGELCFGLCSENIEISKTEQAKIEEFGAFIFEKVADLPEVDFLPLIIADLQEYKKGLLLTGIKKLMKNTEFLDSLL